MKEFDVIIIGGGASGLFASIFVESNKTVAIVEKNETLGKKLLITGKGRCNITNNCDVQTFLNNIPSNSKFLYSAISKFTPNDTIRFFEDIGVETKTERGNRVFPTSDDAKQIVDTLSKQSKNKNVKIIHNTVSSLIIKDGSVKGVELKDKTKLFAKAVIVATGGLSYPQTGSTGDGYNFAKQAGHNVTPLKPSLIGLVTKQKWCKEVSGLTLKNVELSIYNTKLQKKLFDEQGEMLFTHIGISGPIVLSGSAHIREMEKNTFKAYIDLKPALTEKQLDLRILREFSENPNKDISNILIKLMPKTLIAPFCSYLSFNEETKANQITKLQREEIIKLLKAIPLNINDFAPIAMAIITSGGVCVKEINPRTMESKLINGLYFVGEVLDVDGYTGGFNLQIAFSTAFLAANSISEKY